MNSNNEPQKNTKKWVAFKEQNDSQQIKNFTDEIQNTKKQVSALEIAAMKFKLDHRKALGLAEDQKMKIEELNAKIIQLQDQNQKLELENQQLNEKLDCKIHIEEEFLKTISDLSKDVKQKERSQELAGTCKTQEAINNELKKDPKQKRVMNKVEESTCCIV
ncbi:hypothetical protein TanjilG_23855 [Lupinus angustifolius]|uniref:Uncharacterized protein n=2 Tax=Lupinus angustifolius TaxID=3871 RepID=A0A4P1QVT8_LUPAN|nr:hypothetical protein TanjilG_23855 [Lupinus angustifolius]